MNKTEVIQELHERGNFTKKDSEWAVNTMIEIIQEALSEGERVQLTGFGSFEVRERAAREGRNPQNPEEVIQIPAYNAPVFRAGKNLKESVN